ncbi:MAG: alpha/beta hydrolase [Chromatiales bacterium]|nr:MAG: alpha/beta hydrolase [Chromatiales bacterium]
METFNETAAERSFHSPLVARLAAALPPVEDARFSLYKSADGYRAIMDWYDDALELIDCDFESQFVKTRFGHTHMLVAGPEDAEPLLLLPGVAGCAPLWHRQIPAFAEHFRVYALDVVGQPGRSDPYPPSFMNGDYSQWLCDVLDGLRIDRAHFAGTSVGGWMVLKVAIDAPERIRKVVMLSPTGVSRAKLPVKIWLTKVLSKKKDANELEEDLTAKSVSSRSPGDGKTFDRQLARLMALCTRHYRVDRSVGVYNEATQKVDVGKGLRVLRKFFLSEPKRVLRQFNVPGLLVFGEQETLYKPETIVRRAKKLIPNLETEIIQGAGHAAIYDRPNAANKVVIDFLRQPTS